MDLSVVPIAALWEELAMRYKKVLLAPHENQSAEEYQVSMDYQRELKICLGLFEAASRRLVS